MPPRIQVLPETLCNKIAAGEVVERPASVVKELVENAVDAGASEIVIEVEKGGKRLIRVSDDGCGMVRDDLFLSLERHATSKIGSDADLFRLQTLGFRGEALPSIAAVSRMLLRSCAAETDSGWEIYLESGQVKRADAAGMATGTLVEVRDLFFRMPARKKFLRRDETELGHIGEVVTKQAMARPQIGFRLYHHGRRLIEVFPGQSLRERAGALLGRSLLDDLVPVDRTAGALTVSGLIGTPATSRATTGFIYTFINGRFIRDRVVQHAVLDGYRNLLPRGRYPIVVLFLELDPAQVDVNVHPTKHEVRFRQQGEVHDALAAMLRDTLRASEWLAGSSAPVAPPVRSAPVATIPVPETNASGADRVAEPPIAYAGEGQDETPHRAVEIGEAAPPAAAEEPAASAGLFSGERGFFSSLAVLGQYHNSYLLCQDGHDLLLIDQHAAHERIGFERLKKQWQQGSVASQRLLFPAMLELNHQEADQMNQNLEQLERFGFEVDHFGGNSFAVKSVPQLLQNHDAASLVRDVVAELTELGSSQLLEEAVEKILVLMACHGMIRANQALSDREIRALLADLDTVDFSAQCPHGRPVTHRLTLGEVERLFRRG